ncbi:iron-siderophore ABC transporter substrate-binding protein [Paracoccus sp. 12-3]|nr:iron-siderophore ABC transporter substrate-binding protein [Paracoccus xiamenensis]
MLPAEYRPDRRNFLAAGLALAAGLSLRPAVLLAQDAPRLAAIDWAMLETAAAIGHTPLAVTELIRYRADGGGVDLPDTVTDLGLRGAPNYELLQLTRPDVILSSPFYSHYEDRLASIAPVVSLPFYTPGEPPLPKALAALTALGTAIGDASAGEDALARTEADLAARATALRPLAARPLCLVEIGDARHLRAFGFDSLYGSTLDRLGLTNAWAGQTEFSFLAPVPMERLADFPEATLVVIGPVAPAVRRALSRSVLWRALPAVSEGRVFQLPQMAPYGGVPSALRFAASLQAALSAGPVEALT